VIEVSTLEQLLLDFQLAHCQPQPIQQASLAHGNRVICTRALEVLSSAIKIPLILGGGSGQLGDLDWLGAHRVRVALQTHAPFSAAVQAVYDTLKALREGVAPRDLKNIVSPELMRRVTRADDYQQWTKDFLGGG
jgi:carboxyvinyl-carboxyphosphonate phosphorylmutase